MGPDGYNTRDDLVVVFSLACVFAYFFSYGMGEDLIRQ